MQNKIKIEVAYANGNKQILLPVEVAVLTTIHRAILQSGILEHFPEIDLTVQKVGIFGKIQALTQPVSAGDRIEIYRPLIIDPKQARRIRANK